MNEQDRKIVEDARNYGGKYSIRELVSVIDRLDTENKKLKADLNKVVNALVKS